MGSKLYLFPRFVSDALQFGGKLGPDGGRIPPAFSGPLPKHPADIVQDRLSGQFSLMNQFLVPVKVCPGAIIFEGLDQNFGPAAGVITEMIPHDFRCPVNGAHPVFDTGPILDALVSWMS